MDTYAISIIGFFAILAVLIWFDRKNIEFRYVIFLRRTKRFRNLIENTANACPRFWKILSTIGVIVAFYFMFQGFFTLAVLRPSVQLVLPSITQTVSSGPGYILIPFWFWIIIISIILVPHEFSHGVIARVEKIPLKSVGLLLLLVFPGAFVEPDEKKLKRAKLISKLRIFAAGSFANFIVAATFLFLITYAIWPASVADGIKIIDVNKTSPAFQAGIRPGMVITEVNGKQIYSTYREYLSGAGYIWEEIGFPKINETVEFTSSSGKEFNITLSEYKNNPYMGITYSPIYRADSTMLLEVLMPLLTMIWIFSFAVGVFNILPIYPLDGGLMIEAITDKYAKKYSKTIVKALTAITIILIAYGLIGRFFI